MNRGVKLRGALEKINISLPSFANSVLQVTQYSIPENDHVGIPPVPEIEHQLVLHWLDFPYLSKIDFVIPEETMEFKGTGRTTYAES